MNCFEKCFSWFHTSNVTIVGRLALWAELALKGSFDHYINFVKNNVNKIDYNKRSDTTHGLLSMICLYQRNDILEHYYIPQSDRHDASLQALLFAIDPLCMNDLKQHLNKLDIPINHHCI